MNLLKEKLTELKEVLAPLEGRWGDIAKEADVNYYRITTIMSGRFTGKNSGKFAQVHIDEFNRILEAAKLVS